MLASRFLLFLLAVSMSAVFACGEDASPPSLSDLGELGAAVIGGEPSTEEQDAVVLLIRLDSTVQGTCTGTAVSPTLILTARHCLYDIVGVGQGIQCEDQGSALPVSSAWPADTLWVYAGKQRPLVEVARGKRSHSSEDLDACNNDIALLEVDRPLPTELLPLRLDAPPNAGDEGILVGWGASTQPSDPNVTPEPGPAQRQQRELSVLAVGPTPYPTTNGSFRSLESAAFAATEGGCFGDSGAPLISPETNAIIGVQTAMQPWVSTQNESFESSCAGGVTVFHRLDRQTSWLRSAFQSVGTVPWLEGRPRPAAFGAACERADDCISALCVEAGARAFCSHHCDTEPCPEGMECSGSAGSRVCVPPQVESETSAQPASCAAAAPSQSPCAAVLAVAIAILCLRRRSIWKVPMRTSPSATLSALVLCAAACGDERTNDTVQTALTEAPDASSAANPADAASEAPALACGLLGSSTCDPVTAWPCDVNAGESCHYSLSAGGFTCIPNSPAGYCQPCDVEEASCAAGLVCNIQTGCEHYCCSDDDCGSGTCLQGIIGDKTVASVGSCLDCPPAQ